MRRTVWSILVGSLLWGMLAPLASAMVMYDERGKVSLDGVYAGPGFTQEDLPFVGGGIVGTTIVLGGVFSEPAAWTVLPASILAWGATRTNRYRPADVQAKIRANVARNAAKPHPGSTAEILGW